MTIKRPIKSGKNIELKITKQKSILLDEKSFNKKGSLGIAKSFFENKVNYSINKFRTYITYFLRDEANQNNGSCKLLAFAALHTLSKDQALNCFGEYYRQDVLAHPNNTDHQNIRNLLSHGLEGISFEGSPLTRKQP